jgi:hypothetical protein
MPDAPDDRDKEEEIPDGQLRLDNLTDTVSNDGRLAVIYVHGAASTTPLVEYTEDVGYEYTDANRENITGDTRIGGFGSVPKGGCDAGLVMRDSDETHPAGVENLIEFVPEHDVDDVVTANLSEFGGVDEASRVVERLQDEDVTTHLIEDDLTITPDDEHARAVLAAARRASRVDTTDASAQLVTEGNGTKWEGGQPPAGFTVSDAGYLQRDDDWETIRRAARAVEQDELSDYRASQLTGHSRHAIRTALNEYRDAYRVEEADPLRVDDAEQ